MLKLSATAIALTIGLLLTSAIMAAQTEPPRPHAQMNRPLYPTLLAPGRSHGPEQRFHRLRCVPGPAAQAPAAGTGAGTGDAGATAAATAPRTACAAGKQ